MRPHDVQGVAALIQDPAPVLPALLHPRLATRQSLTQQQIWVAQHIALIKQPVQHAVNLMTESNHYFNMRRLVPPSNRALTTHMILQ